MSDAQSPQDAKPTGYRVLARKYRPQHFGDLIGHQAMVQTLRNAFVTGRIAQGWMLTGVRGIGKTTTARILARALNYEREGVDRPSVDMEIEGVHCRAIMEGRHVDVIEMDAASHTGVGDMREIIEAARYKPATARYKVYIIDEVHMLSTAAFNALLKTLEEPPEHVKFIFATTEIRKVPITVLSRCQRFDLRRVDSATLMAHLKKIADLEKVSVDDEAVALIARAAEGSVRDSLTLLDQAIAHGGGEVGAETIRAMLGLSDRGRVVDLFEAVMRGDVAASLDQLTAQYDIGAEPAVVLSDLASFVHLVTRLKHIPTAADDPSLTEAERSRGMSLADGLSVKVLTRAWQILLKGIAEVQAAPRPLPAAEMVLVRLAYAADLPTPDELIRVWQSGGSPGGASGANAGGGMPGGGGARASAQSGGGPTMMRAAPQAQTSAIQLHRFEDAVRLAEANRDLGLKFALERQVRLVRFEDGQLEFRPVNGAQASLANDIGRKLSGWTGRRWVVAVSRDEGAPTVHELREAGRVQRVDNAREDPLVAAILKRFPGAEIVDVRVTGETAAAPPAFGEPPPYELAPFDAVPFDINDFDD